MIEDNLTPYQAGRLVESVASIQKDIQKIQVDMQTVRREINEKIIPVERFQNRIVGVVFIIPSVISIMGLVAAVWVT